MSNSPFGIRQGSFNVNANGTAQYQSKIDLPPGINGLTPELGLVYNHSQGDGSLGVGWSLNGISLISRVAAIMATDGFLGSINYNQNDRFALDGSRLINTSSHSYGSSQATYFTEINQWSQIIPTGTGFTVYQKNGSKYEYGTKTSCNSLFSSDGFHIRAWALNTITDPCGNTITLTYTQNPVSGLNQNENFYLHQITYSGFTVTLNYELRKAINSTMCNLVQYVGGQEVITSCVLQNITITDNTGIIAQYALDYQMGSATGKMQLVSMVKSDGQGNQLPPVNLSWQQVTPGLVASPATINITNQQISNQILETSAVDVNGDGITDLLVFYTDNGTLKVDTYIASYTSSTDTLSYSGPIDSGISYPNYTNLNSPQIIMANINQSGLSDIIIAYNQGGLLNFQPFWSNGDGTYTKSYYPVSSTNQFTNIGLFAIDANGDGITDIVQAAWDSSNNMKFYIYRGQDIQTSGGNGNNLPWAISDTQFQSSKITNNNYQLLPFDVNGDGLVDLVMAYEDNNGHLAFVSFITSSSSVNNNIIFNYLAFNQSQISSPNSPSFLFPGAGNIIPADANGDGLVDLIILQPGTQNSYVTTVTFLSNLAGNFLYANTSNINKNIGNWGQISFYPMGFNGGTQTCILCGVNNAAGGQNNYNFFVLGSGSDGSFSYLTTLSGPQNINANDSVAFQVGDPKGTGKAGFFMCFKDQNSNYNVNPYSSAGLYPDLVNSITDMLGCTTAISYLPITDTSVYSQNSESDLQYPKSSGRRYVSHLSPSQYPIQRVIGEAVYVVSQYTVSNDAAINRFPIEKTYLMQYSDAQIDLSGHGWEGFKTVSKTDTSSGLCKAQTYIRNFPYTGSMYSEATIGVKQYSDDPNMSNGNALLRMEVNVFDYVRNGSPNNYYYLLQTTNNLKSMYVYGQFDFTLASQYANDDYGNQIQKTWLGEVNVDANTVDYNPDDNPNVVVPPFTPLNLAEVVYTYRQFLNSTQQPTGNSDTWVLGLLQYEKVSSNNTDKDITTFAPGDFTLVNKAYGLSSANTNPFNLLSQSIYDNINNAYLTTHYTYDSYGNTLTIAKPGGETTTYVYDASNTYSVQSTVSATGISIVTYACYDVRFGKKVAYTDQNGFVYVCGLDGFGRKTCEQGPVPAGCTQSDPIAIANYVGPINFSNVKVLTLQTSEYLTDSNQGIYVRHQYLQEFPTSTARNYIWKQSYVDALGRNTQTVMQTNNELGNSISVIQYDPCGKPSLKSLPFFDNNLVNPTPGSSLTYKYDVLGRVILETIPQGNSGSSIPRTTVYASGNVVTTTEGSMPNTYVQQVTSHFYNGKSQHIQSVVPSDNNATTTFQYDALGRLTNTIDPNSIQNSISYDSLGRKLTYDNPDQNTTNTQGNYALAYQYDINSGNVATITDAGGGVTNFHYDGLGRISSQTYSDGTEYQFTYDQNVNGMSKLSEVNITSPSLGNPITKSYLYDDYGNPSSYELSLEVNSVQQSFTITSQYDPMNRMVIRTYPDNSIFNATFTNGLLSSQGIGDTSMTYTGFNASFNVTDFQFNYQGSPVLYSQFQYDPMGVRLGETVSDHADLSNPILDFTFGYDDLNMLLSNFESVGNRTESFTYTNKKLITATIPGAGQPNTTFAYDGAGNILTKDGFNYTYDNSHCPSSITTNNQPITLVRDECGRVKSKTNNGQVLNFGYNTGGDLITIKDGNNNIISAIIYDERGKKIMQTDEDGTITITVGPDYHVMISGNDTTITKYLLDSIGPSAAIVNNGSGETISYYRKDTKGNITHFFDKTGTIINTVIYDAFGMPTATTDYSGYMYEGRKWNSTTGLYHFGSRFYDPSLGIFITPDSKIGGDHQVQPGVWNRFSFELNNPICHVDPSGHFSWAAFGFGVAMALVTVVGIAATIVTGGASDALAAGADASLAAAEAGVEAGIEMTTFVGEAGAEAGAEAGIEAGVEAGAEAGTKVTAQAIAKQVIGSIMGGALTSGGMSGFSYAVTSGDNFSWKEAGIQFGIGAAEGAIAGAFSAGGSFLSAAVARTLLSRVAVGVVTGVLSKETVYLVSCGIKDQKPDFKDALEAGLKGALSGALGGLMSDVKLQGNKSFSSDFENNLTKYQQSARAFNSFKGMAINTLQNQSKLVYGVAGAAGVVVISGITYADMSIHGNG